MTVTLICFIVGCIASTASSDLAWLLCLYVYVCVALGISPAKVDKGIKISFYSGGAHWCYLANITDRYVHGGDVAVCKITLTACYWAASQH